MASASSMALFFFFFMIDRTGGGYLLSSLYTVQYILGGTVPLYLCIYVPGRYGTLMRSLALGGTRSTAVVTH